MGSVLELSCPLVYTVIVLSVVGIVPGLSGPVLVYRDWAQCSVMRLVPGLNGPVLVYRDWAQCHVMRSVAALNGPVLVYRHWPSTA